MTRVDLPLEIEERCIRMANALELPLAGVDLRRTPEGQWYCFEINPSPGFTYFQNAAGLAIDEAIVDLLVSAR